MFQLPGLRSRVEREGLEFYPLGDDNTTAELSAALKQLAHLSGRSALRFTIDCAARLARVVLDCGAAAIRASKIDLAIIDQNEPAGGSVAEHLAIPFVSVAAGLPLNREPDIPPPFVPWRYKSSTWARLRNQLGYAAADQMLRPLTKVVNRRREEWNLPRLNSPNDSFSQIAQLCTLPRVFDFPRRALPDYFYYLGPFVDTGRAEVAFPWDQLDGRPLVYASFGTLQNRRQEQFRAVAQACAELETQLVLSAGGGEIIVHALAGRPLVVPYAPQLELLGLASVAITHAGLNTVLEALYCGVPIVAIPVTNDQPAVASRVKRSGAGHVMGLSKLSAGRLRAAIESILTNQAYRQHAQAIRREIRAAGGVQKAADFIKTQLLARPVIREDAI